MPLQPDEITTSGLRKRRGHYAAEAVDELVDEVRRNYEDLWHAHLAARTTARDLNEELERYRSLEKRLGEVFVLAEQAAEERRHAADEDSEALLQRAREQAEKMVSLAAAERDRLRDEVRALEQRARDLETRYRAFLVAALELVESASEGRPSSSNEPAAPRADQASSPSGSMPATSHEESRIA
jgi:cell division initiation protein